ncbi:hypothetical protein [Kitasatospora sp. NPDC056184]|uniref:hypothetical protein n=1 Tax=Kitasatospora sp. NPDC056184 TaxID=3345738 RepID=UPI0035E0162C
MSGWPRWNQEGEPAALATYVRPDEVAALVRLPGPAGGSRLDQARAVYEALAGAGITYAYEAPSDDPARQVVRQPAEVLWSPRHATCLDLALTLAGACLHAGLHPFVLLLDPPTPGAPAHALLGVRIGDPDADPDEPGPPDADLWETRPEDWDDLVQEEPDGPARPLLLLDPVGVAHALPTSPIIGTSAAFAEAARAGARYAAEWTWRVAVDVGRVWRARDSHAPSDQPVDDPLRPPYLPLDPELHRPLQLLRPEHNVVPFQSRDELTVLTGWCRSVAEGRHTGVAVVHGVGGAGKTRLALEVAHRLAQRDGWYAGYLRKDTPGLDWLGVVTSPTLVVLDYADARPAEARQLLSVLRRRTERGGAPAVVLMTARSTDGQWLDELRQDWTNDGHLCRERPPMLLPPEHPDGEALVRRAVEAFRLDGEPVGPTIVDLAPQDWTTLDRLLLAFLTARTPDRDRLPTTRAELYEEVLGHEHSYWAQVYQRVTGSAGDAPLDVLDRAVTSLTLRAPVGRRRIVDALRVVEELTDDGRWREQVRTTLTGCLQPAPGEPLTLRPDPIADHLALRTLREDDELLTATLDGLGEVELVDALRQFNRAAATDQETAAGLLLNWTAAGDDRWKPVLSVASEQGGAALETLDRLVGGTTAPTWLDELADAIPYSAVGLPQLALRAELRLLAKVRAAGRTGLVELATRLVLVSRRQSDTGDRAGALASVTEAVAIHRLFAEADPTVFLPRLAVAVNNLSAEQFEGGDRAGALASITETVQIHRLLAEADPIAFLPDLAVGLGNLAIQQLRTGNRTEALVSITEAVTHYRQLTVTDGAAFVPDLATALKNLADLQSDTGDRAGALASVTEAVAIRRRLVEGEADATALLPDLAAALNSLAIRRADTGDRIGALASITEVVAIRRRLATINPAVFLPDLAGALTNLSILQTGTDSRTDALTSATEATTYFRELAEADPAAFLPSLATALKSLADRQDGTGDRQGALATATEATTFLRELAGADPAAFLPRLATALTNLSDRQANNGDRAGALASITEAAVYLRELAEADPAAFLPRLATALTNLSVRQAGNGDRAGALATATEATALLRELAEAEPAAFLPDLATTLGNLSNRQADNGDRAGALATATEATTYFRELAEADPAAFLPRLASTLTGLSNRQADNGDPAGALASIDEAAGISRRLAGTNPGAFLPQLARALTNLSARRAGNGDRAGALATATEATAFLRELAEAEPAAFLPDLATALANLSDRQADNGDRAGALATATEALAVQRPLAATAPAVFLPQLASTLTRLSLRRAETKDHTGALASITEALVVLRQLAEANPTAFLADLAGALNNLSRYRFLSGDRVGALTSVAEATVLYRRLAEASPAQFLPALATTLNNLSDQQFEAGDRAAALSSATEALGIRLRLAESNPAIHLSALSATLAHLSDQLSDEAARPAWEQAIAALHHHPLAQADLCIGLALRHAKRGENEQATELLVSAARNAVIGGREQLSDLRNQINGIVTGFALHDERLPGWATEPVSDGFLRVLDAWPQRSGWPGTEDFLRKHADHLRTPRSRRQLDLAQALFPGDPDLQVLRRMLHDIDARGLHAVLAEGRAGHHARTLVAEWMSTRTWPESLAFHASHREELETPDTMSLLAGAAPDPSALQHYGILRLATYGSLEDVYLMVTDPGVAGQEAIAALEAGELSLLADLTMACPPLLAGPDGRLLGMVHAMAAGHPDQAREICALTSEEDTPLRREAYAIHLRELARRRPDLAEPANELADVLHPSA